jgi:hypothetical protein
MIPARANIDQEVAQELLATEMPAGADVDGKSAESPERKRPTRRKRAARTETPAK